MPDGANNLFTCDRTALGGIGLNQPIAEVLAGDAAFQLELLEFEQLTDDPTLLDANIVYQAVPRDAL